MVRLGCPGVEDELRRLHLRRSDEPRRRIRVQGHRRPGRWTASDRANDRARRPSMRCAKRHRLPARLALYERCGIDGGRRARDHGQPHPVRALEQPVQRRWSRRRYREPRRDRDRCGRSRRRDHGRRVQLARPDERRPHEAGPKRAGVHARLHVLPGRKTPGPASTAPARRLRSSRAPLRSSSAPRRG